MSRARDLSKLGNPNIIKADTTSVGFGTQIAGNPANASSSLVSAGIVTAAQFFGDGSNLEGVASAGLGTAIDDTKDSIGQNIYYTNQELSIYENTTINAPSTSDVAYTQYSQVTVESGKELIIADGDEFVPDVLGIGTGLQASTAGAGNGLFGTIYVDNIENVAGRGGPNFPLGMTVSGVSTFSGNVSIGGTLTYEDVTNVDSVGLITARSGIDITGASAGVNGSSNLILKTGGTERVRILSDGKTGIGTSPYGSSARLQIYEPTLDRTLILDSGNANGPHMRLWRQGAVQHYIGCSAGFGQGNYEDLGVRAKRNIIFHPGDSSTERLRIGTAGQIGLSGANYGTSGQVLTSGGASAAAQWANASAPAWEFVSTIANPNTSTVEFTGFTTAYLAYKVHWFGVAINTNNDRPFRARIFLDGTLQTGSYGSYNGYGDTSGSATYKMRSDANDSGIWLNGPAPNGDSCAYCGEITFPMNRTMSGNNGYKGWYAQYTSWKYGGTSAGTHQSSTTTQITGVSFDSPDSYNITDGEFFLYRMNRPS